MREHKPRRSGVVGHSQRQDPGAESSGAPPAEQHTVAQQEAWLEEHRQPPSPHPLQVEQARVQQAVDALAACPPLRWLDRMLWRVLSRSYRTRLQKVQEAWQASRARIQGTTLDREYDFEPEMVLIPAGEFLMGSDPARDQGTLSFEQPQHTLYMADYYLARAPVTNAQYAAFVQATDRDPPRHWQNGKPPRGQENHPVVSVSWYDAVAHCRWLSEVTGKPYRLPTEAEWEKAARGADGRTYPWGDRWDAARCNTKEGGKGHTTTVGAYPLGASPYGLLDMAGNVWEWTSSLYWSYPYQATDGREDPAPPDSRVLRGGSWLNLYDSARAAYRRSYIPAYHSRIHGYRCCVSFDPPHSPD